MSADLMVEKFKRKISRHLNFDLDLVVNENRSTMLNILGRKRDWAKLSVHRMFLNAPEDVISAIAHYVRGTRKEKSVRDSIIRGYIQSNLSNLDYSHLLDASKMVTKGEVYDLKTIYDRLNETYFNNTFKLSITWYGQRGRKNRSRVTFGQYFDHLQLIKINRVLDDPFFPDFFVEFVIYHEMIHHLVPGYVHANGSFRVHGAEFKEKEKVFADYKKAIAWEEEHRKEFFRSNCGRA